MRSAGLPLVFLMFCGKVSRLDKKLVLPSETALLIRQQVARIKICLFFTDSGRWAAMKASMNQAKLDALVQYSMSPLFIVKERAALDYATELTKDKKVNPETVACLSRYYSERDLRDRVACCQRARLQE